jgi:DNA invertase Pin-like site-specific DNA recombinase
LVALNRTLESRPCAHTGRHSASACRTEHQKYSTDNQAAAIRRYAAQRGVEIVKTYADEGKSGLRLNCRDELKRLIAYVQSGEAGFDTILV